MPEMREPPETVAEPTFCINPQEVVVNVSDTFSVRVLALYVEDMYGWEFSLLFDPSVVECINVSVFDRHVFSEMYTVSEALIDYDPIQFTTIPMYRIWNEEGRVMAGECLIGQNQSMFTGSGYLCQIDFKAISSGYSKLEFYLYDRHGSHTFLLDSQIEGTTPTVYNSRIIVRSTQNQSIMVASMSIGACLGISLLTVKRKKSPIAELARAFSHLYKEKLSNRIHRDSEQPWSSIWRATRSHRQKDRAEESN